MWDPGREAVCVNLAASSQLTALNAVYVAVQGWHLATVVPFTAAVEEINNEFGYLGGGVCYLTYIFLGFVQSDSQREQNKISGID